MTNTETNIINKLHYKWPVNSQEDKHQRNDHYFEYSDDIWDNNLKITK